MLMVRYLLQFIDLKKTFTKQLIHSNASVFMIICSFPPVPHHNLFFFPPVSLRVSRSRSEAQSAPAGAENGSK